MLQSFIDNGHQLLPSLLKDMGIDIGGGHDTGVAQLFAHELQICAGLKHLGSVGMPEGVEGSPAESLMAPLAEVAHIVRRHDFTALMRSHQVIISVPGAVLHPVLHLPEPLCLQYLIKILAEVDGAGGILRLRRLENPFLPLLHQSPADPDGHIFHVYIIPHEGAALPEAEACIVGKGNHHVEIVAWREVGENLLHLFRREAGDILFLPGGEKAGEDDIPGGIRWDETREAGGIRQRLLQDGTHCIHRGPGILLITQTVQEILQFPGRHALQFLLSQGRKDIMLNG